MRKPAHHLFLVLKIPVVTTVSGKTSLTEGLPPARFVPTSLAGTLLDKIILVAGRILHIVFRQRRADFGLYLLSVRYQYGR